MTPSKHISLRSPVMEDGLGVWRLVACCPPLDANSSYCNMLQCSHFAGTSVIAESDQIVGFISAYKLPDRPDTLFVWQVAVGEEARGLGLASRMLAELLARPDCEKVRFLETTITSNNKGSWALFDSLAKKMGVTCKSSPWLDKHKHFDGLHDSESLVRIGPFTHA
ncbi:MAG: L-2,4-diaminobutyric acid acetyltransferase [Cellvibrionaceae bacterium]